MVRWKPEPLDENCVGPRNRKASRVESAGKRVGEFRPTRPKSGKGKGGHGTRRSRDGRPRIQVGRVTSENLDSVTGSADPCAEVSDAGQTLTYPHGNGVEGLACG